jgi:hypothetical protein
LHSCADSTPLLLLAAENKYDEVLQYVHPDVEMVNTMCPINPQPDSGVSTLTGANQVRLRLQTPADHHIMSSAADFC